MLTSATMCGAPRCGASRRVDQHLQQPVGLVDDDLGVFGQRLVIELSISSNCAAPRMPPSGFLISWARGCGSVPLVTRTLIERAGLAVLPRLLLDLDQLQQQLLAVVDLREDDMHRQRLARAARRAARSRASNRPVLYSLLTTAWKVVCQCRGSRREPVKHQPALQQRAARQAEHRLEGGRWRARSGRVAARSTATMVARWSKAS